LYGIPGFGLGLLGLLLAALAYGNISIRGAVLDAHTLLFASLFIILGYQSLLFGAFTKVFAIGEHLMPMDERSRSLFKLFTLEKGAVVGIAIFLAGLMLLGSAVYQWWSVDFGPLNYSETMRWVIPGVTFVALGFQTVLGSFFLSILGMRRK
jgi:hypothetical protein